MCSRASHPRNQRWRFLLGVSTSRGMRMDVEYMEIVENSEEEIPCMAG